MARLIKIYLTGLAFLLLFSCGENIDIEDKTPPAKPKLITRSSDTSFVETGIDAVADGDYIYLEWQPNTDKDLKGYIIERKDPDSTSFLQISPMLDKSVSSYTDNTELDIGRKYTYRLLAVDEAGNRSEYSFEHHYTLLEKAKILQFKRQGADSLKLDCSFMGNPDGIYLSFRFYQGSQVIYVLDDARIIQPEHNPYYFDNRELNLPLSGLSIRVDVRSGKSLQNPVGSESAVTLLSQ